MTKLLKGFHHGFLTDVIFLIDLQKVFDTIKYDILFGKLTIFVFFSYVYMKHKKLTSTKLGRMVVTYPDWLLAINSLDALITWS